MKKRLFTILFTFFTIQSFCQSGIESGLVAKYCFNGNAADSSGNLRHCTVSGASLTTDRFGTPNAAYSFNGLADFIQMPSDVWVSGNFSFTGWINVRTFGHWSRFFEWGNGIDQDNVFFSPCEASTPTSVFTIHQCSSSARTYASSAPTFPTNRWVHIAITLTGDTARIYRDNALWYTQKMVYIPCSTVRTQCYFGKSNFPADKSLDGKIDDVRIYNRVLSVAEIDTIFKLVGCSKIAPPCDSTKRFAKAGKDTSACVDASGSAKVFLNASGGVDYSWSPASLFSNPNLASVNTSINSTTSFIVKVTDANGCVDRDTLSVKVNPQPIVVASPKPVSKCVGKQEQLKASGALSYLWTPALGLSSSSISNPMLTVQPGIIKYLVVGTDINGCTNTDSININVLPGPTVNAYPSDTFGCNGLSIQLRATGAQFYKWFPPSSLSNDTLANPKLIIAGSFSYWVEGRDLNGCLGFDTINIVAFPIPNVKASQGASSGKCDSAIIQLNATGAQTYVWTPNIYCDNNTIPNPIVKIPQETVFTVVGTNANGCVASDTIRALINADAIVAVPNAFTPNDDQINDKIRPFILCDFSLKSFVIFNRWGQIVYTTNNTNDAWDGNFEGKPCSMDVYYYLIQGSNSKQENLQYKGDITLIR